MTPTLHQSSAFYASPTAAMDLNQNNASKFEKYLPPEVVQIGIDNGQILTGILRINPRNYEDAFISAPAGLADIYICGMKDRNRALAGDLVCVLVEPSHKWRIVGQKNLDPKRVEQLRNCLGSKALLYQPQKTNFTNSQCKIEAAQAKPNVTKEHPVVINGVHVGTLPKDQASVSSEIQVMETLVIDDKDSQGTKNKKRRKRKGNKKKKPEAESNADADDEEEVNETERQKCSSMTEKKPAPLSNSSAASSSNTPNKVPDAKNLVKEEALPPQGSIRTWSDLANYPHLKHLIQITGKVVFIKEQNHPRVAGGHITLLKDKNPSYALFSPLDSRVPRMMIPMQQCPSDFFQFPERYKDHLFMASLDTWDEGRSFPMGRLVCNIGRSGEIEAESRLILFEKSIDTSEFPPEAYHGLPIDPKDTEGKLWVIPQEERTYRRDFSQECVFTIDPSTARDLDDALSIKKLADGTFEVGVHIADVSYFVREGLPLDFIARRRTTSCYLVQKVIPMLPRILCERLCSLNAGEDKLTFSVVWKMNQDAEILDTWFGRSIINSCVKLSYEMAQDIIDDPDRQWTRDELPPIFGKWQPADIAQSIHMLQSLAVPMRRRRFENGALLIDKLKIGFVLDQKTGLPIGFSQYKMRPANHLVEEYMLLANISVAHRLHVFYPNMAFLRRHPEPDSKQLAEFALFCKKNNLGDDIDITTSRSLHETMSVLRSKDPLMAAAVSHYLLKSMSQAVYFCAGSCKESFRHYALSVDLYTHFTSPIRRYPDVIVHRMLAATLNQSVPGEGGPQRPVKDGIDELDHLANRCNEMKKNAREASEASSNLFLKLYYRAVGPVEEEAVVTKILDNSLEILLLNSAFCNRISLADHKPLMIRFETANLQDVTSTAACLKIYWKPVEPSKNDSSHSSSLEDAIVQTIAPCDRIKVQVKVDSTNLHKLNTLLIHPHGHKILCEKEEDWSVEDIKVPESSEISKPKELKGSKKEKSKKKKAKNLEKLMEKFTTNLVIGGSSLNSK